MVRITEKSKTGLWHLRGVVRDGSFGLGIKLQKR